MNNLPSTQGFDKAYRPNTNVHADAICLASIARLHWDIPHPNFASDSFGEQNFGSLTSRNMSLSAYNEDRNANLRDILDEALAIADEVHLLLQNNPNTDGDDRRME
jgi:hypothetical protein